MNISHKKTLYGLETGAAYSVGARFLGLANNGMSAHERLTLSPSSEEFNLRVGGSKLQVIGWNLYTLLLWTLKMCMCVFYSRLTYVNPTLKRSTSATLLLTSCSQRWIGPYADACQGRLRPDRGILPRGYALNPLWLPSPGEELANIPKSRQYVIP